MYLVGFYSPKQKAGVTETSLLVAKWLQEHTDFSIAIVANGKLVAEPNDEQTVQQFAELSLSEQKRKLKKLKSTFDIVIYDASSSLTDESLRLLPIADRLFVLGEDDRRFVDTLHHVLDFNKSFDRSSKDLVNEIHNDGVFVLQNHQHNIGFTKPKEDIEAVCEFILNDYLVYHLHKDYIKKCKNLMTKIKKFPKTELGIGTYNIGLDFDKAMLFQKFVQLRVTLGQPYDEAVESLFPTIIRSEYAVILQQFQNEMNIAQFSFK